MKCAILPPHTHTKNKNEIAQGWIKKTLEPSKHMQRKQKRIMRNRPNVLNGTIIFEARNQAQKKFSKPRKY
jgi:hypothetical protein